MPPPVLAAGSSFQEHLRPPGDGCDESLVERTRRVELLIAADGDPKLQRYCIDRSRRDLLWWFAHFAWGYSPDRAREEASPLLLWPYVREILCATRAGGLAVFDKSRWIGVTYAILALFLWEWLFLPGSRLAFSSRTGADVDDGEEGSLAGKFLFMLRHLPPWMIPRWHDVHSPRVVLKNLDNGSSIVGWKATPTAFHGPRYRRIFVDEASRVACLRRMMTGVSNASPNVTLVGTPDGRLGYFPELVHGDNGISVKTFEKHGPDFDSFEGWRHMRFHYRQDPRKTPAFMAAKKAASSAEHFAEQWEIDYEASTPGRIWPEWRRGIHCCGEAEWEELVREGWIEEAPIIEAWDVGIEMACVWLVWLEGTNEVIAVDHRTWHDARPDQIARDVAAARSEVAPEGWFVGPPSADGSPVPAPRRGGNPRGRVPELRVADPAIKNRRQVGDKRSWAALLREVGLEIRSRGIVGRVPALQAKVRDMIADGRFMCSPRCCVRHNGFPSLVEAIEGYKHHVDPGGNTLWAAEKDDCSHLADALQYGIDWAGAPASLRSVRAGADGKREEVGGGRSNKPAGDRGTREDLGGSGRRASTR